MNNQTSNSDRQSLSQEVILKLNESLDIHLKDGQSMEHIVGQLQSLTDSVLCVVDGTTLKIEKARDISGKHESTIKSKYSTEYYYRRDDDTLCCYFTPNIVKKDIPITKEKDVKDTINPNTSVSIPDTKGEDVKDVKHEKGKDTKDSKADKNIKTSKDTNTKQSTHDKQNIEQGIMLSSPDSEDEEELEDKVYTVKDSDDEQPDASKPDVIPDTINIRQNDDPHTVLTMKKL
jgi:hypothetical protein